MSDSSSSDTSSRHIEGVSTVFGTALNYVALRLLGIPRDHPIAVRARRCLISLGGAIGIPSWGKLWLALLGLYDWEGMNPITPELWLLPHFLPFHPGRYWVHTRAVYMPMSYLYGRKYTKPLDDLTNQLREVSKSDFMGTGRAYAWDDAL